MQAIWAVLDWLLKFTLVLRLVLKSQGIISKVTHLVKNVKSFCFSETFASFWVGELFPSDLRSKEGSFLPSACEKEACLLQHACLRAVVRRDQTQTPGQHGMNAQSGHRGEKAGTTCLNCGCGENLWGKKNSGGV